MMFDLKRKIFVSGVHLSTESFLPHAINGMFPIMSSKKPIVLRCNPCKLLIHAISVSASATTEAQRMSRTLPSSKYPLTKLSPVSQKTRMKKVMVERKNFAQKLKKLEPFDCQISEKQDSELLQIVSQIDKKGSKAIDEIIKEGDRVLGEDNLLRDAWRQDVTERLEYEKVSTLLIITSC